MRVFKPLVALFLALFPGVACGQLLQVNGTRIVNSSSNQEVILNAVNFGNWMVMEGRVSCWFHLNGHLHLCGS